MKHFACGVALITCFTFCEGHLFRKDGFVGIGLDLKKLGILGSCPSSVNATCPCGSRETPIYVPVAVCSYTHRWKTKCKPCKDVDENEVCLSYRFCEQCHMDGGDECATCPSNKFGKWCENVCTCVNGGTCERDGKCTCPDEYHGRNCEVKKGCNPPGPITYPVQVVLSPPNMPVTAVYSCPEGYVLNGPAISTCLSNKKWSSTPPICSPACPLLSAPANGRLTFSGNELVEGDTAEIVCNPHHRLIGERVLTCLAGGHWSEELPVCEKLAFCPDPGDVRNAERRIPLESVKIGGHFLQDSRINYKCRAGYEQMGSLTILCLFDGTWSDEMPSCIKVSSVTTDCHTKGSQIVSDPGTSVRVVCPPECADEEFNVWGTSIYRQDSSVCQAAIHSAKITNSGGPVDIINNGEYSHFTGGLSNNIESKSFADRDESFRFDRLQPLHRVGNNKAIDVLSSSPTSDDQEETVIIKDFVLLPDVEECEKGLVKLDQKCAYISNNLRSKQEAEAVCSNMGLSLELPSSSQDRIRLVTELNIRDIDFIWVDEYETFTESGVINRSDDRYSAGPFCPGASVSHLTLKRSTKGCEEPSNFVCTQKSDASTLAVCRDPGPLQNGNAQPVGQIDGVYYVGSSIEFSCQPLHYLNGDEIISCLTNGSWSSPKPGCIKVNACEDPPIPIGGFLTFLPPLKSPAAQRAAVHNRGTLQGMRVGRLPVGLSGLPGAPQNAISSIPATPEPEPISLPPGLHRIGARAMYDCESRYYKLIGSRTRRCQGAGEWSGRPPTCIPVCGRSDSPRSPFIVNGNASDVGQWPWQVGIARHLPDLEQWFLLCGASLLNERWVITAAHCVTYAGTTLVIEPNRFQLYFGKYHRQDTKDDEYVQVKKIEEIHIHPDYDPGLMDADIALIQLDSPVQLNSRVQPICLPTEQTARENLVEGKKGVVTGWGMNENSTYSETLQQAVLPVVSQSVCEKGYEDSDLPLTVTDYMFCAGFARGRADACSGDSGGPMVFTDDSSRERKWVLEGIVSWGSPQGCGNPNQYGGFTTVSRFLDWIHLYF